MNKANSIYRAGLLLMLVAFSTPSLAITKCKDADGKWHYGDFAVQQCKESKVTTLTDRGFVKDELAAPKTAEELASEREAIATEEARLERERLIQEQRARVLSIYETESDIDRQRDNQLNSVQGNIEVHNAYLKSLKARIARTEEERAGVKNKKVQERLSQQIAQAQTRFDESSEELSALKLQKVEIMKRFENEKKIYRELKGIKVQDEESKPKLTSN